MFLCFEKYRYLTPPFNRPGFKEMLADIEAGLVGMVVVKDMSRFGRNYLETGMYTEIVFPEKDIRFVAVNDGIESAQDGRAITTRRTHMAGQPVRFQLCWQTRNIWGIRSISKPNGNRSKASTLFATPKKSRLFLKIPTRL